MLFNSYSYEILHEQFHWIYLQGDIKLLLVTVNNRLKCEIEIVHDLSCHPIQHRGIIDIDTLQHISTLTSNKRRTRDPLRASPLFTNSSSPTYAIDSPHRSQEVENIDASDWANCSQSNVVHYALVNISITKRKTNCGEVVYGWEHSTS